MKDGEIAAIIFYVLAGLLLVIFLILMISWIVDAGRVPSLNTGNYKFADRTLPDTAEPYTMYVRITLDNNVRENRVPTPAEILLEADTVLNDTTAYPPNETTFNLYAQQVGRALWNGKVGAPLAGLSVQILSTKGSETESGTYSVGLVSTLKEVA